MSYLQFSGRCSLFEAIAESTWRQVLRYHAVDTPVPEVGITAAIVVEIRTAHTLNQNIGVWANRGWREIDHGSDIDIFVEIIPGQFVWWALQSKVLRQDRTYDARPAPRERPHWDKLAALASSSGCMPKYLLYNGVADYRYQGNDECGRVFAQEQFGCSLVDPLEMARVCSQKVPRFEDFHPSPAQPWRIIACCHTLVQELALTRYTAEQIKDSLTYYRPTAGNTTPPIAPAVAQDQGSRDKINPLPVNAIRSLSASNNRVPRYQIVIRTTSKSQAQ